MSGPDFENFCRLALQRSGLVLGPDKAYLVASRLEPIARAHGLTDVPALLAQLRVLPTEALVRQCIDAMATHESLFFRDGSPFEQLAQSVLPPIVAAKPAGAPIRIWCAACSSGQEPYSIAMLAKEQAHALGGRRVEIVATDMVEAILLKARAGLYSDFEVQRGLSPERRNAWMERRGGQWEVSGQLKAMVSFRKHNLLEGMAALGTFDVIFCRNVLIYFDQPAKSRILTQLAQVLSPEGALFLGSAETVMGLTDALVLSPGSRGVYRRKDAPAYKPAAMRA